MRSHFLLLLALCPPLSAQSLLYWDTNVGGSGSGGSGTWDSSSAHWNYLGLGIYVPWVNASPTNFAAFGGTAGTVTVGANVTVQALLFSTSGYTIAGSGSNSLTFDESTGSIDTGSGTQTISAVIAGNDGLTKTGPGNLLLSGANTYTGNTRIKEGTLTLGAGGSISANETHIGTSNLLSDEGTFRLTGGTISNANAYIGYQAGGQGFATVTSGTWTSNGTLWVGYNGHGNLNINGGLVTVNGITRNSGYGYGSAFDTITLSGTSGNRGTLSTWQIYEDNHNLGAVIFDGGILQARINESNFLRDYEAGDVTINSGGAFIDSNGFAIGISTPLSGTGGLTKLGAGNLTLSGTNTYAGDTVANSGTLTLGAGGSISHPAATMIVGSVDGDVGTLRLTNGTSIDTHSLFIGNSGTGSLVINGGTVSSSSAVLGYNATNGIGSVTVSSGTWTNASSILVGRAGSGSLAVSGGLVTVEGITYTGFYYQSSGSITLSGTNGNRGTLSTNQVVEKNGGIAGTVTFDGGILQARVDESNFISGYESSDVTINSGGAFIDSNSQGIGIASPLSGVGGLTKQGAGKLTLSGANTYSGGTTVEAGTLIRGTNASFVDDTAYTVNGGILQLNDFALTASALAGAGGSVDLGTATLTVDQSGNTTCAGVISGTGGLTKTGAGTLALSAPNPYSGGTIISGGTLSLGHATDTLANTRAVTISGGTLALGTNSDTVGAVSLSSGSITGSNGTLTGSSYTFTNTGSVSANLAGSGALTKTGAGTVILTGANSYNGGTTLSAGTLQGSSSSLKSNITNHAALVFDQSTSGTYSSAISGTGNVSKQGAGTLTLSGANTYTGGTTISAGTLALSHATDTLANSGAVTIAGGTLALGGNSDTVGAVSLSTGSITGTGTLTASSYAFTNSGAVSAHLAGIGALTKTGSGTLTLTGTNTYSGGTTLTAGRLDQGTSAAFAPNTAYIVNGGTLDLEDFDLTASSLSGAGGSVSLYTTTLTVDQSSNTTYAGAIVGLGELTKQGTGTLSLTGDNTYTSNQTTVNGGTLSLAGANINTFDYTIHTGTLAVTSTGSISSPGGKIVLRDFIVGEDNGDVGIFEIATGGSAYSDFAYLGLNSGSKGTANISGTWSNTYSDEFYVGHLGTGLLTVQDGGYVQSGESNLGSGSGSTGTADISGTWETSTLKVGASGTGTLTIQNGGSVASYVGFLGRNSGSTGTADISGSWTTIGSVNVGYDGTGSLTVQDGGSVLSQGGTLGRSSGISGTADISGTWTNSDAFIVGFSGSGSLTIRQGGTVSNTHGYLGLGYDGTGTADIFGTWTNSNSLNVGDPGDGTLTIQDGGIVNVNSGAGLTTLADYSGSTGTLNILGSTAAGILNTATVHGSTGTAVLNFNHTASDYHFTTDGAATGTAVAITGSAAVNHLGTGTTIFSVANTYTGATAIDNGTLLANNTSGSATGSGAVTISSGASLGGTGSVGGPSLIESGGTIAPGASAGTLTSGSDITINGTYQCEIDGPVADKLAVTGNLNITAATLDLDVLSGGTTALVYIIASYGSLTGAQFATVTDLPAGMSLDYAYDDGSSTKNIALIDSLFPFSQWAQARGLTLGVNDGLYDDPNSDGTPNLAHFAFDTDPLGDGTDEGKRQLTVEDIGGTDHLTFTLPVRAGATFSGDPLTSDPVDGLIYSILGDSDLQDPWELGVVGLVPALSIGLPALGDYDGVAGADWEYRSFYLATPLDSLPHAFMNSGVTTTAP
jgi:fibronectin-binding autotransporter adhesin